MSSNELTPNLGERCLSTISRDILGNSVHLRSLTTFISQKWLVVEQSWPKFGPLGANLHVLLTLKCVSSVCISDFQRPCISKTADRRGKLTKIWDSGVVGGGGKYLVHTGHFWLLIVQGEFEVIRCISNFWRPCVYFWLLSIQILLTLSYLASNKADRQGPWASCLFSNRATERAEVQKQPLLYYRTIINRFSLCGVWQSF